jgi:AbiV family abortive infection protein
LKQSDIQNLDVGVVKLSLNQLKVEEVEEIFKKIYDNACELLDDAEILFSHKKYARAYLCSHIAFEEFGKLPMLNSVALGICYGKKVDWKKFNRRFRNHKS